MIFFLLTGYWIIAAQSPVQFIVPAVLITIRMCYVSRGAKLSPKTTLMLLLIIFAFTFWSSDMSEAILIVIRVGAFIILFGHLVKAPRSRFMVYILSLKPFTALAYFLFYLERMTALVLKRYSDVQYAVSVRMARGRVSYW